MCGLGPTGGEQGHDIHERLTRLRGHATLDDALGDGIPPDLPGQEQRAPFGGDGVGVA
jgi:hypothetical protein